MHDPWSALVSWQLPLALDEAYGEWSIWIPLEKLDSLSLQNQGMFQLGRSHQNESQCHDR